MLAYDSTLRVPLVLVVPGRPPAVDDQPVSLVELAGTLVQLAGRPVPGGMHAGSLLAGPSTTHEAYAETQYPRSAGWHSLAALADERWKLIQSSELELYDLTEDPPSATISRRRRAVWPTRCGNVLPRSAASEHRRRRLFLPMPQSACERWATSPVRPQDPPTASPRQIP